MIIKPDTYVPSLRWRMGEYQALSRLSDSAKDRVTPFIVVPEIEFDFEKWQPAKTLQDHVGPFADRYKKKWDTRPAWIDVHPKIQAGLMDDGKLPIAHVFDALRPLGTSAVPVVSLDGTPAITAAVAAAVKLDGRGVGLRLRIAHIMKPGCKATIDALLNSIGVPHFLTDLIIDLGAPAYQPYDDFADGLIAAVSLLGDLGTYRSFVIFGSAYPESVALDKPGGDIPRHDWIFYQTLIGKLSPSARIPNFGDYTIVNPEFTPRDMRMIKSGGKVVYTEPANWHVRKGGSFRDNPAQMHDHCAYILSSGKFRGSTFSEGDDFIEKCAKKIVQPSNQPRWKQVAISHHIMHALEDISKFGAAA
jgi:hypothetical protein